MGVVLSTRFLSELAVTGKVLHALVKGVVRRADLAASGILETVC